MFYSCYYTKQITTDVRIDHSWCDHCFSNTTATDAWLL